MAIAISFQLVGRLSLAFQKPAEKRTVPSDVVVKVSGLESRTRRLWSGAAPWWLQLKIDQR